VQFCFCSHFPKDIFPFFLACRESLFVSGLICFLPSLVRVPRPCTNGTHQPESRRVRTTPHGPKLLGGGLHKTRAGLSLVSARRRRPLRRPASTRQVLPIDASRRYRYSPSPLARHHRQKVAPFYPFLPRSVPGFSTAPARLGGDSGSGRCFCFDGFLPFYLRPRSFVRISDRWNWKPQFVLFSN
jgi:hypothetical protein